MHAFRLLEEGLDVPHEPLLHDADLIVTPLPPPQREKSFPNLTLKAIVHDPRRVSDDNRIRRNNVLNDCSGTHDCTITNGYASENNRADQQLHPAREAIRIEHRKTYSATKSPAYASSPAAVLSVFSSGVSGQIAPDHST